MTLTEKSTEKQPAALRAVYTGLIFLAMLSMGLVIGISGPSMVDLRYLMGSLSTKEAASTTAISLHSTFVTIGAATGGFLSFTYKWSLLTPYINRQLVASLLSILSGFAFAYTAQIHSLYLYYALSTIGGIGLGNMNAISITWLIEMWSGRLLAGLLQALQLSYGVGTILGPLIIRPNLYGYMNGTQVKLMNGTTYEELIDARRHSLTWSYLVVGAFFGFVGFCNLFLYLSVAFRYRKPSNTLESSDTSPETTTSSIKLFESPQARTQLYLFIAAILIIFAGNNTAEIALANFQDTFLQSLTCVQVTASEAAEVTSLTATSYSIGRGLSIIVSMVLSPGNMLLIHYSLALAGFVGLLWSTTRSLTLIRVNSALIGYSFSATMPAMFTYINLYSTVDDRRNAFFHLAMALPSIFMPILIGHYIEAIPAILVYIVLAVLALSATFFTIVRFGIVPKTERKARCNTGNKSQIN